MILEAQNIILEVQNIILEAKNIIPEVQNIILEAQIIILEVQNNENTGKPKTVTKSRWNNNANGCGHGLQIRAIGC
jgi:hypothetical protein